MVWDCREGERVASMGTRPATYVAMDRDKLVLVETVRKESTLTPAMNRMTITTAEIVIRPVSDILHNEDSKGRERRIVFSYHREGGVAVTSAALVYSSARGLSYFVSFL